MIYKKIHLIKKNDCLLIGLFKYEVLLIEKLFENHLPICYELYESLNTLKCELKTSNFDELDVYNYFIIGKNFMEKLFFLYLLSNFINQPMKFEKTHVDIEEIEDFVESVNLIPQWFRNEFEEFKQIKRLSYQIYNLFKVFPNQQFYFYEVRNFFKWLVENNFLKIIGKIKSPLEYHLNNIIQELIIKKKIKQNGPYLLYKPPSSEIDLKKIQLSLPFFNSNRIKDVLTHNFQAYSQIVKILGFYNESDKKWLLLKLKELERKGDAIHILENERSFWKLK